VDAAVTLDSVSKTFGTHAAVRALTLSVPRGCIYGFIGPNGSGKTTTIRMLLHILLPDGGRIEVLGSTGTRAANDRIGYLPEERGLYKKMKVLDLLAYYGALKGLPTRAARAAGTEWLERMGLAAWGGKRIETLSKGMAQKVQFISTVLHAPDLLILDEPFSGLDPVNLQVLRDAILDLRRRGTTVLFSTHDMEMAERMCDFICMIFRGEKVLDGTLDSIQARYGSDSVRLRAEGARELLAGHGAVEGVIDMGHYQEVRLARDSDGKVAQELLQFLAARTRVQLFEVARPSLHDIFVRIAGPEAARAASAPGADEPGGPSAIADEEVAARILSRLGGKHVR
jgi:ABC-2 type transport system ATP-binding protein